MNEMRKLMEALGEIDDRGDGPDEVIENHSITYRDHVEIRDYEQDDSRDSSGDPRSRDSLRRSMAVGDGELNRAVVNTESGELLFVGPQDQAEQFVDDLENELEVVELPHRPYCEVWPRESGSYSWFRGTREECEHFIHGDSNLDESRVDDEPELDLDFGLDEPEFDQYDAEEIGSIDNDEPQDEDPLHVHHQSRIKASIVRVYRALGDDNPNPMLTLNALRRLTQGKMPMGPQAQNLATLSSGILGLLEDPAATSLLIRALNRDTNR